MKVKDLAVFLMTTVVLTNSVAMAAQVPVSQLKSPAVAESVIQSNQSVRNNAGMTDAQYQKHIQGYVKDSQDQIEGSIFELKTAKGFMRTSVTQNLIEAIALKGIYEAELQKFETTGVASRKEDFNYHVNLAVHRAHGKLDYAKLEPGIARMIELQDANRPLNERGLYPGKVEFDQYLEHLGCRSDQNELGQHDRIAETCGPSPLDYSKTTITTADLVNQEKVGDLFRNVIDGIRAPDARMQQEQGLGL